MKKEQYFENLLLNANLKTGLNIIYTNENEIIYYVGESEKCTDYLYALISDSLKNLMKLENDFVILEEDKTIPICNNINEEYKSQAIYYSKEHHHFIIFYSVQSTFSEDELAIIQSTIYLAEKYFNA